MAAQIAEMGAVLAEAKEYAETHRNIADCSYWFGERTRILNGELIDLRPTPTWTAISPAVTQFVSDIKSAFGMQ